MVNTGHGLLRRLSRSAASASTLPTASVIANREVGAG
eukprot:CAMPEP_0202782268 /NCGR_PEP_ID=MMETSP1388-20130828/62318_1 /ASSEMBLY_ACC=CAM_ASM_000864 /TAXON_ID=37098 /ORGANISM="Isochrysis sp, Strain CCMP1244" /LENGTH=36 /DNA_ID= /DNA_START= /DNA_END= /DNA_ORIENTATION=